MALGMRPSDIGQMQTASAPAEPFLWGAGGQRMTPEQIALEQKIAAELSQVDYSPVAHWTQGLARVAGNALGGLREHRANKAADLNAAEGNQITQALMSPAGEVPAAGGTPSADPIVAALMNPNTPKAVRDFAEMKYREANRPPPQPGEFERALEASGVQPGTPEWQAAMVKRRDNMLDPMASVPLPGGQVYLGPRSGIADIMGGGGAAAPAPGGASPPATLPPDFDFAEGGPTPGASGGFRP